jgi:hypothetical protein
MSVEYSAKSLEDIALMFEDMAEKAAAWADRKPTKMGRSVAVAESRTWTNAAEILRKTHLDPA